MYANNHQLDLRKDHMDNSTKLAYLKQELEDAKRELKYTQQHERITAHMISQLTRKERTNRLCTRAGMLESFLRKPEQLSNDQVMELLKVAFAQPKVREALEEMLRLGDDQNP